MRLPSFLLALALLALASPASHAEPVQVSGIYPHLASFNGHGECGIGAVVPWAGKLWWLTYPPHEPKGSNDKLYSIDEKLALTVQPESVGGTHANRMIHRESNQLIMGPYFIDDKGHIRVADIKTKLIGRLTAVARHLTDPANLVYFIDMEGPVYEVNVHTLEAKKLFEKPVPGWHGKGGYTSQGRLVISNNGELPAGKTPATFLAKLPPKSPEDAGVLAEWDGTEWRIIERHQFTEVTGPGGIKGAPDDKSPLWAMGWDKRSVMLKLLDGGQWSTYRLPKGSYTFDPKHGWYTEWPRIREINDGKFLAVMHGQMFDFPATFSRANSAGIRPLCTHLRYVPDFTAWSDKLVIASDDTSLLHNPLAGQSQSNLWFGTHDDLKTWGPTIGWGGVWSDDAVRANTPSDPFLFAGYQQRVLHLTNGSAEKVTVTLEVDSKGDGNWQPLEKLTVEANSYLPHIFAASAVGEWVRLTSDRDAKLTAYFHYANPATAVASTIAPKLDPASSALIRPAKENRNLQVVTPSGYYEVDENLIFTAGAPTKEAEAIRPKLDIKTDFTVDAASAIVTDRAGRRWRLPKTDDVYDQPATPLRGLREIESERYAGNWHGIFYEIPRAYDGKNNDEPDYVKMKPITTHRSAVTDFCTWRGILVISGGAAVPGAGLTITSADGKASLWCGKTDDLWRFGKPVGHGGPWKNCPVTANEASDPYLMTNFDKKTITLSHNSKDSVEFTVEVDFLANGQWHAYRKISVPAGETVRHAFPEGYQAHWVRLKSSASCEATAQLLYE
ncbi:MAG: hypothetical protein RL693_57 [Verrucomicrobiota bacterium]|jgi:hypothetical protein